MSNTYAGRYRKKDLHVIATAILDGLYIDDCEYGGWCIDSKRPFGNSDVNSDMIDMLGIDVQKCPHCNEFIDGDDGTRESMSPNFTGMLATTYPNAGPNSQTPRRLSDHS